MRSPNRREKQEIARYLITMYTQPDQHAINEVAGTIAQAKICVIDGYISDGPGYAGKLIFIVFSGGPEIHELLCYRDGKLERVVSEYEHMARRNEAMLQGIMPNVPDAELDIPEHDLLQRDLAEPQPFKFPLPRDFS